MECKPKQKSQTRLYTKQNMIFTASQASLKVYIYVNTVEEFFHDNDTFLMLLCRYNNLIKEPCFRDAFPADVFNIIESRFYLAELSALCGVDDILSYLEMFAEIKRVVRKFIMSVKLISNRMKRNNITSSDRDIGSLEKMPFDILENIVKRL